MFLLHFDPGARGDFLHEWLTDNVSESFKSDHQLNKIHYLNYNLNHYTVHYNEIKNLKSLLKNNKLYKIRINSIGNIPQVLYNTFLKNSNHIDYSSLINYGYQVGLEYYNYNRAMFEIIDYYNIVIPFIHLTDIHLLIDLYKIINKKNPTEENIKKAKINLELQKNYNDCNDIQLIEIFNKLKIISDSTVEPYKQTLIVDTKTTKFKNFLIDLPLLK